ncbi:helix-turn-helix domain-containing protein [Roseomonas sp. 18066]|uniref:helix-turn-helix domain-containing protein n=1 Tax=Roseomonas sp. 18066 TaxID=2681412 RepID=UPI00135AF392|nr:helix-turn-helix transcriptional regulator [Roseomonas sp. 18066]
MISREPDSNISLTGPQLRAARALLGWTQHQLHIASDIPQRTIARLENGTAAPHRATILAIRGALEVAGVELIRENGGGAGVRLKRPT